jgi:hypothetical protein
MKLDRSDKIIIAAIIYFMLALFFSLELWQDIRAADIQKVENVVLKG